MMKKILILLMSVAVLQSACKKDKEENPEEDKVTFSYSKYNKTKAQASVGMNGSQSLYIVLQDAADFSQDAPVIEISVDNYTGPGTYPFGEHVRVSATQDNLDEYWQHYYYNFADVIYTSGTVTIEKLTDERIVASVDGKLVHSTSTGRTETTIKASVNHWR